jgi:hypothetical protein
VTFALRRAVRLDQLAPWLLCGVVFATAVWAAQPYPVGVFHDDGVYVTLAKALAGGDGFRYLNLPGAPVATHYPPVYPLLLAALWKVSPDFPQNIPLLQLANAVALALTAAGSAVFARRVLGWTQAAAIAAALVGTISYPLLGLSGHVLSEPLFAAVLFPSLILAERAARDDAVSRDAWVAGAAAGVLTLVRTHGIALVGALVLLLMLRRQWRLAAFAGIAAMMVLTPWQVFVATHDNEIGGSLRGKYSSYVPWLLEGWRGGIGFVGATIAANVREINALLADRFSLSDHALPRLVSGVVAGIVAIAGAIRLARRAPVTSVFIAAYMTIVLLWPFTPWRFFYALWPVVIVCIGEAIHWLADSRPRAQLAASAGLVMTTVLALGAARAEARAYREQAWHGPARAATLAAAPLIRWVESNTRPDDVIAVEAEQVVYLFTGRRALPPQAFTAAEYVTPAPLAATTQSLRRVLTEFPVTFLVTTAPLVYRSARTLTDSSRAAGLYLVPLQTFSRFSTAGGAFRVERSPHSTPAP